MTNQGADLFEESASFFSASPTGCLAAWQMQKTWCRKHFFAGRKLTAPKSGLARRGSLTRLCINHLKLARVQREEYVGTWLPEPVVAEYATNPRDNAEQAESLSIAFLVILETLSPTERAVYLLKEVGRHRKIQ
jgi:RNA polymerase sigma-70 factor (ECF subfamily)